MKSIFLSRNQVNRLIESRMLLKEITSDLIYHWASPKTAYSIIASNEFRLMSTLFKTAEAGIVGASHKNMYYMSLTRNKNIGQGGYSDKIHPWVRFTLDGQKLNSRYHIKGIDYWGASLGKNSNMVPDEEGHIKKPDSMSEWEDRLYSRKPVIQNALNYIKAIDIYIDPKDDSEIGKQCVAYAYGIYRRCGGRGLTIYTSVEDFNSGRYGISDSEDSNKFYEFFEKLNKKVDAYDAKSYRSLHYERMMVSIGYIVLPSDATENDYFSLFKSYGLEKFLNQKIVKSIKEQASISKYPKSDRQLYELIDNIGIGYSVQELDPVFVSNAYKILTDFCYKHKLNNFNDILKYLKRRELQKGNVGLNLPYNENIPIPVIKINREGFYFCADPSKDKWVDVFPQSEYIFNIKELYRTAMSNFNYDVVEKRHNSRDEESFKKYIQHKLKYGNPTVSEVIEISNAFPNEPLFEYSFDTITCNTIDVQDLCLRNQAYIRMNDDYIRIHINEPMKRKLIETVS